MRGIAIKVGPNHEGAMLFDTELLRWSAGWTGGFLDFQGIAFDGAFETNPSLRGELIFCNNRERGWWRRRIFGGSPGDFGDPRPNAQGLLPEAEARYRGLYRSGRHTLLSYTVGSIPVLELPGLVQLESAAIFTRTLQIAPTDRPLWLLVANATAASARVKSQTPAAGSRHRGTLAVNFPAVEILAGLVGAPPTTSLEFIGGRILVHLPPQPNGALLTVALARVRAGDNARFDAWLASAPEPQDLKRYTRGGPSRWPQTVETRGRLGTSTTPDGAYAVDTITAPTGNPYQAWMRLTAFDFFRDGRRAAVATLSGDVWIVSGLDAKLDRIVWKRFATGLFQPLGLRIVNDEVFVNGRDQLTRLRDLDGDGEADFYECFNNDVIVTPNFHEFAFDLQTDSRGSFYFTKGLSQANGGQTRDSPHQGIVARISSDGKKFDVVAQGLRAPNGLSLAPDDRLLVSDNEGIWVPASRLDLISPGAVLGVPDNGATRANNSDQPLLWLPKAVDNSCGGATWVPDARWGPLQGRIVHTSYGSSGLFLIMTEHAAGRDRAATMRFPLEFESGIMRPRFNPVDGQLYVCGLRGWQTTAKHETTFQRVRYTGKPVALPADFLVRRGEIDLGFTTALDRASAENHRHVTVRRWNYQQTGYYGSPEFSAKDPSREGRDVVAVRRTRLSADGRTLTLEIPDLAPVMQMEITLALKTAAGDPLPCTVYTSIAQIP